MDSAKSETIGERMARYVAEIPADRLSQPEPHLYSEALRAEMMKDVAEVRKAFKYFLSQRRAEAGNPKFEKPGKGVKAEAEVLMPIEAKTDTELQAKLALDRLNAVIQEAEIARSALLGLMDRKPTPAIVIEEAKKYPIMDKGYFSDPKNVEADLKKFLAKGEGISIDGLSKRNPAYDAEIVANNGENVKWGKYLYRASVALSTDKSKKQLKHTKTLDLLKALLGIRVEETKTYPEMDKEYFLNPINVKADLMAFLVKGKGESIERLTLSNPEWDTRIFAHNGEDISWRRYLNRASVELLGTKYGWGAKYGLPENPPRQYEALCMLKGLFGIRVEIKKKFPNMDRAYFLNLTNVKADLKAFQSKAEGVSISNLTITNPSPESAILAMNGETVEWRIYLSRAYRKLFGEENTNLDQKTDALNALKKFIGIHVEERKVYPEMNKQYFLDPANVEFDLRAHLAKKGGKLEELSTAYSDTYEIVAKNGEGIKMSTYYTHASRVLFGTDGSPENPHRCAEALHALKKLIGIQVGPYKPMARKIQMTETYVRNVANTEADLWAFLRKGEGDSLEDLRPQNNPKRGTWIIAQNGERIIWQNYLNRVSVLLLGTKGGNDSKNPNRQGDALKALKQIVGVSAELKTKLDTKWNKSYFSNPKFVEADLNAFLAESEVTELSELSTVNPKWDAKILAQNGEWVIWATYLNRASCALLGTRYGSKNPHRRFETLNLLRAIIGNKVEKYLETNEANFPNSEKASTEQMASLEKKE